MKANIHVIPKTERLPKKLKLIRGPTVIEVSADSDGAFDLPKLIEKLKTLSGDK